MSAAFFSWQHAILQSSLPPTVKHVCLTIGCHMAMDGTGCFPSYATVAEETGLTRRCVIKAVQVAEEFGYLEIQGRNRENGSYTSNVYKPVMPPVDNSPPSERGSPGWCTTFTTPSERGSLAINYPDRTTQVNRLERGTRKRENLSPPNPQISKILTMKPGNRFRAGPEHVTFRAWLESSGA